jgi:hypothetical protein
MDSIEDVLDEIWRFGNIDAVESTEDWEDSAVNGYTSWVVS